jgi:hypothetical protein
LYLLDDDMRVFEMQKAGDIYTYSYATSGDFSGEMTFLTFGVKPGEYWDEYFISSAVKVIAKPDLSKLAWLQYTRDPILFLSPGATYTLGVEGLFSDGTAYNLTGSQLGTVYSSSDPSVAVVSSDGTLEALSAGEATITAALSLKETHNFTEHYLVSALTGEKIENPFFRLAELCMVASPEEMCSVVLSVKHQPTGPEQKSCC